MFAWFVCFKRKPNTCIYSMRADCNCCIALELFVFTHKSSIFNVFGVLSPFNYARRSSWYLSVGLDRDVLKRRVSLLGRGFESSAQTLVATSPTTRPLNQQATDPPAGQLNPDHRSLHVTTNILTRTSTAQFIYNYTEIRMSLHLAPVCKEWLN